MTSIRFATSFRAALLLGAAFALSPVQGQSAPAGAARDLETEFRDPPNSARPRVWWHWMNGNVTEDGIAKDIAWMSSVGIGGLQAFDAQLATPQIVAKRLVYMDPDWKKAFRFAASEADRNSLELAIAGSAGWSETGGPWVSPADGMKKLVWSETQVSGGRPFKGKLAPPPANTGPYQQMPFAPDLTADVSGTKAFVPPAYYRDTIVLAVPATGGKPLPVASYAGGDGKALDWSKLYDGDHGTQIELPLTIGFVSMRYAEAQTVRSATLTVPGNNNMLGEAAVAPRLEASDDDGTSWRKIADFPPSAVASTISFAPVRASRFRVVFAPAKKGLPAFDFAPGVDWGPLLAAKQKKQTFPVAELTLSADAVVNLPEAKAGFEVAEDYYALDGDVGPEVKGPPPQAVIDLTGRMRADGTLDWTPPNGNWRILRFGYSLLGKSNHPATAEATGLEVDKYDGAAVRRYLDHYLDGYTDATGKELIGSHGLRAMVTDSIEVGPSNWTPDLIAQFKRLRGYDPTPWLPALAGVIIGSRAESDGFLYDFRRTLGDLIASEHYGTLATVAHERGLKVYGEAFEAGRPSLGDDMALRAHTDVPMAALWTFSREMEPRLRYYPDMKGASSVAHVYGQNLAAAESLTSMMAPWAQAPADLRRMIDLEFAYGINRPVIHTSVHQPVDDKQPGLSLLIFGQYFTRHETWADMARPWVDYMARNARLLQEGRNFADVAFFYGEEAPLSGLFNISGIIGAPVRYAYDFVNTDAVMRLLHVEDGDLVAPSGARYRVLYLGGTSRKMTVPILRRIAELARAGATIIGMKPEGTPSLADDPAEFANLVGSLWGGAPVTTVGKGRVVASADVERALGDLGVVPDVRIEGDKQDQFLFVHRRLADGDIYFVNNRSAEARRITTRFRVAGKQPEIWRADTGARASVSYRIEGSETVVPLEMAGDESFFVIFRKPAQAAAATFAEPSWQDAGQLAVAWRVSFEPGRGAGAPITLAAPQSLSANADSGVKYFSGVSTWTSTFSTPQGWRAGQPLRIDLGKVGDIAEVRVNGVSAGIAWKPPYALDIAAVARPGRNSIEVRIANLWLNRLIGDAQPGAKRITFVTAPTYRADAPLRPSGLIGPVRLLTQTEAAAR